jgi:hypothetical protein
MQLLNNARIGIIISIEPSTGPDMGSEATEEYALVMWAKKPGIFTDQISQERLSLIDKIEVVSESR